MSVRVTQSVDGRLLLPVEEAARRLSIGRSLMYELLGAGEIRSVRIGRLRRVPVTALDEYVSQPVPTVESTG